MVISVRRPALAPTDGTAEEGLSLGHNGVSHAESASEPP